VNADAIAVGLSPFNPKSMAIQAGRLMLARIRQLAASGADFAFETTLAARTFVPFLKLCKSQDYTINLIYFWLQSPDLAVERVARRVASGGHSIPEVDIRRRYQRSCQNLLDLYLPLCDSWIVYNNSDMVFRLIAEHSSNQQPIIYDSEAWYQILRGFND
jgi:predicted ABC-type ATPase